MLFPLPVFYRSFPASSFLREQGILAAIAAGFLFQLLEMAGQAGRVEQESAVAGLVSGVTHPLLV